MKSMPLSKRILQLTLGLASAIPASAAVVEPVTITSDALVPAQHLLASDFHPEKKAPASLEGLLAHAKRAYLAGDHAACLKSLTAAAPKAKAIQAWTLALEIDCAVAALTQTEKLQERAPAKNKGKGKQKRKVAESKEEGKDKKPNAAALERLHQVIAKVERNTAALLNGPAADTLRTALIKGLLVALDAEIKLNSLERASKTVERLEDLAYFAEDAQRAKLWRGAAELAYLQQDTAGAIELLRRSLAEQDSSEARARLIALENTIKAAATPAPAKTGSAPAGPNPELEASKEEIELVERATAALKAGDLVSAVDDAVKLITTYPGGSRAKWASDRIMESYWSIAEKTDVKLIFSRAQIVRKMQDVDGDRLAEWARQMYNRGQWDDAMTLSSRALDKLEGSRTTAILDLAAKSALASDQFEQARRFLDRLILAHAGTAASREALLRSGLLYYRLKNYQSAVADFERLLMLPQLNSWELPARYWLWRSLQKVQAAAGTKSGEETDRVSQAAAEIIRKYPFSYYGLRARIETNSNSLEWKSASEKFTAKFWLTASEKRAWERVQVLLRAGWLDEAQIELRTFPTRKKAEDKAVAALLAAAAGSYGTATKLANEAWDENPELRREPLVNAAFPKAFAQVIDTQADSRKLDRDLLRGLIKQESSFNPRAVSSSNAYGLTQVIGPTAREIAQDLKQPAPALPDDLFQPERSVQFGAYYLAKLLNKYSGSVPLALASYNAGPARIDRWLKARPSLKNLAALRSSAPEDELWFDEIPYGETSGYVKAILRNLLIYKMLDNGRVQVTEPIWAFASQTAATGR